VNSVTRALRAAREKMRLDPAAFASLLDIDVADVRDWDTGTRNAPSSILVRCARALALTVDEVLSGDLDRAPLPSLFLRAETHRGRLDQVLELSDDLALFVETARSLARLREGSSTSTPSLPSPPTDPHWGVAEPPYKADELATWLRGHLGIATPSIPSMRAVYDRLGITIVWARQDEMSPAVDGASLLSPQPTVLVHLVEGPLCWWRTRMTLAHELCHLLCDFADDKRNLALVSPTSTGDAEAHPGARAARPHAWKLFDGFAWLEQRASAFASHLLVPDDALRLVIAGRDPVSEAAVTTVCSAFGVGRITAVSRIKHVFRLSEEVRLRMLRRPHEERHIEAHPDLPPPHGIRAGVLLDEVAAALAGERIDRVEAHRILGLSLTEPLPEHPKLSELQRAPLRSVDDDVRAIVSARLARAGHAPGRPTHVYRGDAGWRVSLVNDSGETVSEESLSFDLDAERTKPSM
jgi:IrrE N-terminal-like domain